MTNIQFNKAGELQHCLTIKGMSRELISTILNRAQAYINPVTHHIEKTLLLENKTVINLFFENSTRTRTTFEIAAKKLSADVVNLNVATSSTQKGESVLDTVSTLHAMGADILVIRHAQANQTQYIAEHLSKNDNNIAIINGGEGVQEHPTQALLDMLTIRQFKKSFESLKVAIIGDITHSRVAHSDIIALKTLGVSDIRIAGPEALLPDSIDGVKIYYDIAPAIKDCDVIIMLRLQSERMAEGIVPDKEAYFAEYGLTPKRLALAKPDAIVMHPGPINREVEIASQVADGSQSVILRQVHNGIAIRMAVMAILLKG